MRSKSYERIAIKANDTVYKIKAGGQLLKTNNSYWIGYLMTYLLFDGKVSIYETRKHTLINRIYVAFYDFDMDIKGPYTGYSIYAPDGWLIQKSRAYNEKLDFLMEKKFF